MRRIIKVLVVATMIVGMLLLAGPAFAQGNPFTFNPGEHTKRTGEPALCRALFASDLEKVSGTNSESGIDFVFENPPPTVEGPAGENAC